MSRPHLVLVLADDLGYNATGFSGNTNVSTPYLDALVGESLLLERHYAHSTCVPSRAALYSGRFAHRAARTQLRVGEAAA